MQRGNSGLGIPHVNAGLRREDRLAAWLDFFLPPFHSLGSGQRAPSQQSTVPTRRPTELVERDLLHNAKPRPGGSSAFGAEPTDEGWGSLGDQRSWHFAQLMPDGIVGLRSSAF